MDLIDLARLRRGTRLAYERGRFKLALLGIVPLLGIVAIAVWIGSRPASTLAFGLATTTLAATMLWYGRDPQRAVLPGIAAGLVPLVLALCASHWHHCSAGGCTSFCLPACALGGVVAGLAVASAGNRRHAGKGFWLSATALALLTGAMGCTCIGYAGVFGLALGYAAGTVPELLRRAFCGKAL